MKQTFLLLILLLCLPLGAQQTYRARVVDAETEEPVPYASIYVSKDNGTLTNVEGDFTIEAKEKDSLTISFIGYKRLRVCAKDIKDVIRLESLSKTLQEVTVLPAVSIAKKVGERLAKEFHFASGRKSTYYYRLSNRYADKMELVEAYLTSRSATNLRDIRFNAGRKVHEGAYAQSQSRLAYSNLQHLLEVGPVIMDTPYWNELVETPLIMEAIRDNKNSYWCFPIETTFFYNAQRFENEGTHGIYKINTGLRSSKSKPCICGTLYVDAKDYRLLAFEGSIRNLALDLGKDFREESGNVASTVRITYTHRHGYTEVESLVVTLEVGDLKSHSILFNLGNNKLSSKKGKKATENMLDAIDEAQDDSTLWQKAVVQRTKTEEKFLREGKLRDEDIQQWQYAQRDSTYANSVFRTLMERLEAFSKTIPQEKVYVHMDNTCYFQGDTIWFAAYTRQTNDGKPSRVSGVLYVELLNNDGYLVERKLIKMQDGQGSGFFALNKQIQYSGFYELRAYTRWQLNWGRFEHRHSQTASRWFVTKDFEQEYYRDYEKLYSRVFPVYDRPQVTGDYTRDMTMRVMRRTFKDDPDAPKPTLTLFPEGGNLVAGVENRVAFEATMSDGEWLKGSLSPNPSPIGRGTLGREDSQSKETPNKQTQITPPYGGGAGGEALSRGRGVFTIVPEKGMEQEVTFITEDGRTVKAKLPKPEEQGAALQVKQEGDSICIEMHLAGVNADSLAMTIMHEGRVEEFHLLTEGSRFKVQGSKLPCGVHQVTVFDATGRVWADRLFFVKKQEEMQPTLTVSGTKEEYQPYEQITLDVQGKAKDTPVSLAVRDGYQADALFDNANIMAEMLLSSEIRGFVPDPGWFFEKDDEEHRQALDLLMMTQGWRRFDWRDMAVRGEWDLTEPDEKTPIVQGTVRSHRLQSSTQRNDMDLKKAFEMSEVGKEDKEEKEEKVDTRQAVEDSLGIQWGKPLDKEVRVHVELQPLGGGKALTHEKETRDGHFRFHLPGFFGSVIFFADAADTTKWKGRHDYQWVRTRGMPAEFHVKIDFPFPRFVKPYAFYQNHLREVRDTYSVPGALLADSTHLLGEVSVTGRRRGRLRRFDQSQPALIMDAYEAWNMTDDSGINDTQSKSGSTANLVRTLFGDYGLPHPYVASVNKESDDVPERIYRVYGIGATRRGLPQYIDIPVDSLYHPKYLQTLGRGFQFAPNEGNDYTSDKLHKYVIYSDYCPRLEGSKRYEGSNLPETRVAAYPFYDGSRRAVYVNRRYILDGFAQPAEFYSPDYTRQKPQEPTDYRRTLYWNPNLQLDAEGRARVTLFNNSRTTQIEVDAAGQASDGTLLWK